MSDDDLDQIRGGLNALRAMIHTPSPSGRPFISRHNLSALGVKEGSSPTILRAVTTRTTDSRKDEFDEIFKAGYFCYQGEHHLLVMYDWKISRQVMVNVIAPFLFDVFDFCQGDLLTSALVELVSTTEKITRTHQALKWMQRILGSPADEAVSRNEISLHVALLTLEEKHGQEPKWKMRQAANTISDFHVSPRGRLVVLSDERAFEVDPKVFIRAVKGSGWLDEDFQVARQRSVKVGPNAVLSRYTPDNAPFNIPVYDNCALIAYGPDKFEPIFFHHSEQFVMTSADGTGTIFAVERTVRGRRKVTSRKTDTANQATVPITPPH